MPDPIQMLDGRVDRLETAIADGLAKIEALLREQITSIKTEQIKDLKDNYQRLADDQGRLWDAVRDLEKARYINAGGARVFGMLWNFISAVLGGSFMWVASRIVAGGASVH